MPRTVTNLILLLVLVLIGAAYADIPDDNDSLSENYLQSPSVIQADKITNITVYIDNNTRHGVFDSYHLYLAIDPIHQNGSDLDVAWTYGACYLVNSTSSTAHNVSIQIPASVGIGGVQLRYAITAIPFNQSAPASPNADIYHPLTYGNKFSLSGGSGEWSPWELDGASIGYPLPGAQDYLPCTQYDCARHCYAKYYPANLNEADNCGLKLSYECAAACPGTSLPSFEVAMDALSNTTARPAQDIPANCNTTAYMSVTTSPTSAVAQPSSTATALHSSASSVMVWKDVLSLVGALMLTVAVL